MSYEPLNFAQYMRERHRATQKRLDGKSQPWSSDQVIATKKLCSVFRDDDRTSIEARNIIYTYAGDPWALAVAFRWVNRAETLQAFADAGMDRDWGKGKVQEILDKVGKPFNTSAYKINPPGGLWNRTGVAQRIVQSWNIGQGYKSARATVRNLIELNNAPFISYQIMQDLRWLRGEYDDEQYWALIGPGAARGLHRIAGSYTAFGNTRDRQQNHNLRVKVGKDLGIPYELRDTMNELLSEAHVVMNEPTRVNMFEVEHNLCEWDKYVRMATGEATGTSFKPKPNLPAKVS